MKLQLTVRAGLIELPFATAAHVTSQPPRWARGSESACASRGSAASRAVLMRGSITCPSHFPQKQRLPYISLARAFHSLLRHSNYQAQCILLSERRTQIHLVAGGVGRQRTSNAPSCAHSTTRKARNVLKFPAANFPRPSSGGSLLLTNCEVPGYRL